jgi:hypothetical protein
LAPVAVTHLVFSERNAARRSGPAQTHRL